MIVARAYLASDSSRKSFPIPLKPKSTLLTAFQVFPQLKLREYPAPPEAIMQTEFASNKKCAHPPCSCQVGPDDKYCSAQCEAMEKTPDLSCECHHAGCHGNIGS